MTNPIVKLRFRFARKKALRAGKFRADEDVRAFILGSLLRHFRLDLANAIRNHLRCGNNGGRRSLSSRRAGSHLDRGNDGCRRHGRSGGCRLFGGGSEIGRHDFAIGHGHEALPVSVREGDQPKEDDGP